MADERCVYENVLRDASSLCVDIFRKLTAILMETSDQPNVPAERICGTVVELFGWLARDGELHSQHCMNLKTGIANVIENRACEHGLRYKGSVEMDPFWNEKRLRTLKDARRATRHHHVADEGIAPLLDWVKTGAKKEIKEWKEYVFHLNFGLDELFTVGAYF